MFYSHNLLARKGPLGTVWCAAHLQSKLNKANYTKVHIPSTVEQIMNPVVPIALRMSGYLLFGVVRIYSKKVEYLQQDCNQLRIEISKAYAKADINLPEDASQAKYESITLPDNFALDLIDIHDNNLLGSLDTHLRSNEDISITDYSPASFSRNRNGTPAGYIMISVGEGASRSPSVGNGPGPSSHPHTPPSTVAGVQDDPEPNHHLGSNEDDVPPLETLRDNPYLQKSPLVSSALPDIVEPDQELVKAISQFNNNAPSILDDDIPDNGGPSSPPKQISSQESTHSDHHHSQNSFGPHVSFELAPSSPRVKRAAELAPSPPRVKRRRIKFDEATVLTNEFMKKSIDDASGLKRKRKGASSFLGVYRLNNAHKKEKVLFDPVITGLCDNLSQMHEDDYVSSKAHLINIEQDNPDPIEGVRFSDPGDNMMPISPPDNTRFSSSPHVDENTPAFSSPGPWSKLHQAPPTTKPSVGPTPDAPSSFGSFVSDFETPFSQSQHGFDNGGGGGLYNIPEAAEEFAFIEQDGGTPSLRDTPEPGSLLPRTRGVAKLIKEKSAATPSTSDNLGSVSLNSLLQGKTKKVCSRMFFETLVLKSCDLVDVKQDKPYGDITLKVTSKLSKLDFSNEKCSKAVGQI